MRPEYGLGLTLAYPHELDIMCRSAEGGAATALDPRAAKLFEEEAEAERRRALREAANFEGCYPALVTTLLHLLPQKVNP